MSDGGMVIDEELADYLGPGLKRLLEGELELAKAERGRRVAELREQVASATSRLEDDDLLDRSYEEHLGTLPEGERPRNLRQRSRLYVEYEKSLESSLIDWRRELESLENQSIDDRAILERARQKVLHLLRREGLALELDPYADADRGATVMPTEAGAESWRSLDSLREMPSSPVAVGFPDGVDVRVSSGVALYRAIIEWLIVEGKLAEPVDPRLRRWLREDRRSQQLSNGMWLFTNLTQAKILENARLFVAACGDDPSRFHALFS